MIAFPYHRAGILSIQPSDFAFVHRDHDIIKILFATMQSMNIHIHGFPDFVDGTHCKLSKKSLEALCSCMVRSKIILIQRWFRNTINIPRRLAVTMAPHPRLGPQRYGLNMLHQDLALKICNIAAPLF